ncbi:MAG: hypothetical protein H7840_14475, partial [Alphaproteobacteria bacterium]
AAAPAPTLTAARKDQLAEDCRRLIDMAKTRSMRAVALADEIREGLKGYGYDQDLEVLESALTVLDFKTALATAQTLAERLG